MKLRTLITSFIGLSLAALASVARQPLAADYAKVKTFEHIYALPNVEQLKVFSLGYHAALADLIFSDTLVRAGMYFKEHVIFKNVGEYLNAVVELDQGYRDVYVYADALLTLSTVVMPAENFPKARKLMEKGIKVFPDDIELWVSTGRFLAFTGSERLPESEDPDEWKARGAEILEHACYLGIGLKEGIPPECLSSSRLLEKVGKTQASISNLRRLLAISDDPKVRAQAYQRLSRLLGEEKQTGEERRAKEQEDLRLFDIPFLPTAVYELLGPSTQVIECVGATTLRAGCVSSFAHWDSLRPQ